MRANELAGYMADRVHEAYKLVMGDELTTYVHDVILPDLLGLGLVYTHEGVAGGQQFLYNYFMTVIGNYVDPNIVYGIMVARDAEQNNEHDPGKYLMRDMAIDTVTCSGATYCSDYFVGDFFYIDEAPYAANEFANDPDSEYIWPWPEVCEPLEADGYANGEYSCWILPIPLEYYVTYKKIKVRVRDNVNNWRRLEVYDYEDAELWIEPPPDNADYDRCDTVDFKANITPSSLEPLLPYVEWVPVDDEGNPRPPVSLDPENGYRSIITYPAGPPWYGENFQITIKDHDFWVKAYLFACNEEHSDIKHVTDPEGVDVRFINPSEDTFRRYEWNDDFTEGQGWLSGGQVFKQYVNYPDGQQFEGTIVNIEYSISPLKEGTIVTIYPLLDPPTDIFGNQLPTNTAVWDVNNPPADINDNMTPDDASLIVSVNGIPQQLPLVYTLTASLTLPDIELHTSQIGGNNYEIGILVSVPKNGETCDCHSEASLAINVWRKGEVWVYAMDNYDEGHNPPQRYNPDYPFDFFKLDYSEVSGACDDAFIEWEYETAIPITVFYSPIHTQEYYPGYEFPVNGILFYCDKQEEQEQEGYVYSTDFHEPWDALETRDYSIQLLGADLHQEDVAGKTTKVPDNARKHKHSLIFVGFIYADTRSCILPDASFDDCMAYTSTHEVGESLMLDDDPVLHSSVMSFYDHCAWNNVHYFSSNDISSLRNNTGFP